MTRLDRIIRSISVIVPTYNSSGTIERCLQSIRDAAAGFAVDIIVIDDGSADIENLRRHVLGGPDVRLIEKPLKTNAAHSRAMGLEIATGDLVFFLDSDDRFMPDHIRTRINIFAASSCSVIFGRFKLDDGRRIEEFAMPSYEDQEMERYIFIQGGDCRSSTISLDPRALKGTTFDRTLAKHQDWGFALAAERNGEVIGFDQNSGVVIDIAKQARMSAHNDVDASLVFMKGYLKAPDVRAGFLLARIKKSIKLNDRSSGAFYRALRKEKPSFATGLFAAALAFGQRTGIARLGMRMIGRG